MHRPGYFGRSHGITFVGHAGYNLHNPHLESAKPISRAKPPPSTSSRSWKHPQSPPRVRCVRLSVPCLLSGVQEFPWRGALDFRDFLGLDLLTPRPSCTDFRQFRRFRIIGGNTVTGISRVPLVHWCNYTCCEGTTAHQGKYTSLYADILHKEHRQCVAP